MKNLPTSAVTKERSICLINVICGVNQYENLLFPKMKGDDKKREIRFKQIERTLKIKNYKGNWK